MSAYGTPIITAMIDDAKVELHEEGMLRVQAGGTKLDLSPEMTEILYKFFNRIDVGAWFPGLDEDTEEDEF
jgi:hypothetical protein